MKNGRSFGRRTQVNVLEGKRIRKHEDGTDIFDDYWTDSENMSVQSMVSIFSESQNKSIASVNKSNINKSERKRPVQTKYSKKSSLTTGRRTGVDVTAGKHVRKCEDGTDVFEDYFTPSHSVSLRNSSFNNNSLHRQTTFPHNKNAKDSDRDAGISNDGSCSNEDLNVSSSYSGRRSERNHNSINSGNNLEELSRKRDSSFNLNKHKQNIKDDSENMSVQSMESVFSKSQNKSIARVNKSNINKSEKKRPVQAKYSKKSSLSTGRRTGVDVTAGKHVRKCEDGTDVFEDYFTPSHSVSLGNSSFNNNSLHKQTTFPHNKNSKDSDRDDGISNDGSCSNEDLTVSSSDSGHRSERNPNSISSGNNLEELHGKRDSLFSLNKHNQNIKEKVAGKKININGNVTSNKNSAEILSEEAIANDQHRSMLSCSVQMTRLSKDSCVTSLPLNVTNDKYNSHTKHFQKRSIEQAERKVKKIKSWEKRCTSLIEEKRVLKIARKPLLSKSLQNFSTLVPDFRTAKDSPNVETEEFNSIETKQKKPKLMKKSDEVRKKVSKNSCLNSDATSENLQCIFENASNKSMNEASERRRKTDEREISCRLPDSPLASKSSKTKMKKNENCQMNKKESGKISDTETNLRRSKRRRVKPLAHWRNQRLRYKFTESGGITLLELDEGTSEDLGPAKQVLRRFEYYKRKKNPTKSNKKKVPSTTAAPIKSKIRETNLKKIVSATSETKNKHVRSESVALVDSVEYEATAERPSFESDISSENSVSETYGHLVIPRKFLNWNLHVKNDNESVEYRISKCYTREKLSFGYIEIPAHKWKALQYLPDDDLFFNVISGHIKISIHDKTYKLRKGDSFMVPHGTPYNIYNFGNELALCSFTMYNP